MRIWHRVLSLLGPRRPDATEAAPTKKAFIERRVTVDGSEYLYQVYVPPMWSKDSLWPIILALHGGGGYGSDGVKQTREGLGPALRKHPERFPAVVVFPQSPANGTPGWQQIGGRIALAALAQAQEEFHGDPARISLTGLSIGGNGAWYLAYHQPQRFAALLVICGFVAERRGTMYPIVYPSLVPELRDPSAAVAARLADVPSWLIHGDADRTVAVEHSRRMAAALRSAGAPVRYTELAGVDHNAWDYAYHQPDIAGWLLAQRLPFAGKKAR